MRSSHLAIRLGLVCSLLLIVTTCAAPVATSEPTVAPASATAPPATPQRIVAQDYLGELLALGVTPVGTSDRFFDESTLFAPT